MWLSLAFMSALLLGFYDVAKKQALKDNAVPIVLLLNTLFSTLLFLPILLSSELGLGWFDTTFLQFEALDVESHLRIMLKSAIVLSSWVFDYIGIKHLPLTIVGPINATRPVLVLLGALLIFGERLNLLQWAGVTLALFSIFLLSRAGKREGINFASNRWILCVAAAALLGAASGLYDRHIMRDMEPLAVQSWYNLYQAVMMGITVIIIALCGNKSALKWRWSWAIPMISILLSAADMCYFVALSESDAMISVVSMIRRGSVVVSFACGAVLLREKNLKAKALDLVFILIGMVLLWLGSRA
ncbi:MAG: DMT family transporter [Alistipes sp.]|nr:DMT family transporter [Alistipes sp.]